jgi:hypothetical protein
MTEQWPLNRADSEYVLKPYIALVEEYDGGRVNLRVNAIGPKDARGVAWQTAIDRGYDPAAVLKVEAA